MTEVTRTPSLEEQVAQLSGFDHVTYHKDDFSAYDDDGNIQEATPDEANVISSEVLGMTGRTDIHTVAIDVDLPCKLVPSTTPGHFHLYVDKLMPWDDYAALLRALATAGIVQPGYVAASLERGFTLLRLPWIKKETT